MGAISRGSQDTADFVSALSPAGRQQFDTGIVPVADGIFAVGDPARWTLRGQYGRRWGPLATVRLLLTYTGPTVNVPANGDIANQNIGALQPGWTPRAWLPGAVTTAATGPLVAGYADTVGVLLTSVAPGSTFGSGTVFDLLISPYFVAT